MWKLKVYLFLIFSMISIAGCTKSPSGTVSQIRAIRSPTFSGASTKNFTAPSTPYALIGQCDVSSHGLQFSYDHITWTAVADGCADSGNFSVTVSLVHLLDVYVRAGTGAGFTSEAHALIALALPPTSESMQFVTSGAAGQDGVAGTQNAVESTFTKQTMTNGTIDLKPSLIDVIYGP